MRWTALLVTLVLVAAACQDTTPPGRPSPTSSTTPTAAKAAPTPTPTPLPPRFAPDGRTRNPALNTLIDHLIRDEVSALDQRMPRLQARDSSSDTALPGRSVARQEWLDRLSSSPRVLYAVAPADPQATPRHEVDIVLEVGTGMTSEAWRFAIAGNNVVELWISRSWASVLYGPYENYLVLPSRLAPPPEAGHALDPDLHVSDPGVDRLLQALIQRDTKALAAAVLYDGNGTIRSEQCTPSRPRIQPLDPRSVEVELTQITTRAGGVHSIINVPEGAVPPAKHLIVISIDKGHGEWVDAGLLEANGQIVGISLAGCVIMPPLRFLVAPLESRPGTTPEPRTGITYVDRAIDAYEAGDREAIRAAFIFRSIRCTTDPNGSDGPPRCRADEPPGTPVAMASFASCEGYYTRADEIDGFLNYITAPGVAWRLGAILDVGPPTENGRFFGESTIALLEPTRSDQERGTIALLFSSRGVSAVWSGCGVEPTLARLARFGQSSAHDYLLAPPPKR